MNCYKSNYLDILISCKSNCLIVTNEQNNVSCETDIRKLSFEFKCNQKVIAQ